LHYVTVQDLVADAHRLWQEADNKLIDNDLRKRALEVARLVDFRIVCEVAAWVRLGREHGLDSLALWRDLPGWPKLRLAIAAARRSALKPVEVQELFRQHAPDKAVNARRPVALALDRLRHLLGMFLGSWKTVTK
jgi:hypothetical protein